MNHKRFHRFTGCKSAAHHSACLVDDLSGERPAMVVDTSLGGVRVVRELERLASERALPQEVVSDNGTELTSGAVLRWATGRLAWHYIEPGKPRGRGQKCQILWLPRPWASNPNLLKTFENWIDIRRCDQAVPHDVSPLMAIANNAHEASLRGPLIVREAKNKAEPLHEDGTTHPTAFRRNQRRIRYDAWT